MAVRVGNTNSGYIPKRDAIPVNHYPLTRIAYYEFDANGNFCAVHTYTDADGRTYSNRTVLSNPAAQLDAYDAARERERNDLLHFPKRK